MIATASTIHRQNGFTLIEIMVALVIFAVLSVTLLVRLGGDVRSEQRLEEKTLASLVAEDTLSNLRVKRDWSAVSSDTATVQMMGRKWSVVTTVNDAGNENLRRVDVRVSAGSGRNDANYLLTGFVGKF